MFKKYNWKQPLYKNDVINVLINGFLAAFLGGILAGLLDYLFGVILQFPITIGLMIICYLVGSRMRRGYYSYHILYPVLSILFMILALVFSRFAYMFCLFPNIRTFANLISYRFYLDVILNPIYYIIQCIQSFNFASLILGILNLVIYIFAFRFCYRSVQGRN